MSSTIPSLDIQEQIIRIDRAIAETQKFQREADKLRSEERKLDRDRWLAPAFAAAGFFGATAIGATVAFLGPLVIRHFGGHYP